MYLSATSFPLFWYSVFVFVVGSMKLCISRKVLIIIKNTELTSTLSPYKLSLWFSLLKTCAGYLFLALQAISSASMRIIRSSGIPNRFTVLIKTKENEKNKVINYSVIDLVQELPIKMNYNKNKANLLTDTKIKYLPYVDN